jgi:pantoate--beta-alanine ligase
MRISKTVDDIRSKIKELREGNLKTGFVPTMGALHEGHLSLIRRAKSENDVVIASIFVNPTQFNNPEDLKRYPRTPEKDLDLLEKTGTDLIFFPEEKEIYPAGMGGKDAFSFGDLENVMEGKFRPGHFKGVAQVVSRLFEIINPGNAYFGEKDFQQLAVIRELVRQKNFQVNVVGCPTVREPDGLAMSSRNLLLTPEVRKEATKISRALFYVRDNIKPGSASQIKADAIEKIESGMLKAEYLEIADAFTLQPMQTWNGSVPARCLTAVQAGNIRLIDNVQL